MTRYLISAAPEFIYYSRPLLKCVRSQEAEAVLPRLCQDCAKKELCYCLYVELEALVSSVATFMWSVLYCEFRKHSSDSTGQTDREPQGGAPDPADQCKASQQGLIPAHLCSPWKSCRFGSRKFCLGTLGWMLEKTIGRALCSGKGVRGKPADSAGQVPEAPLSSRFQLKKWVRRPGLAFMQKPSFATSCPSPVAEGQYNN